MKFARLIWANLTRNKRRTILTILSVAVALFLFATLRSVLTTLDAAVKVGSETRLITRNAISLVFPLPQSYTERLRAVDGVEGVSWANWFGGVYRDPQDFFASFAVDADTYFALYPEMQVPPDEMRAFMGERTAAMVGGDLMKRYGWKVGDSVTLRGTIFPGDWPFTIRAVYHPTTPYIDESSFLFHWDYLYERSERQADPGWYVLKLSNPDLAPTVAEKIDDMFRNSSAATKTSTERAFQASFIGMYGNIGFFLGAIGLAVFFAILLVAANTMMMAARERTTEYAVLKALGYGDKLLFGFVLAEAALVTLVGGALGVFGAKLFFGSTTFLDAFFPGFGVTWPTIALGLAIAVAIGLLAGLIPALRAARLPVVQALRQVA
ncbi:MAG TPA: FtsX-like permease family protein [Gemmatimonadota bacterium]